MAILEGKLEVLVYTDNEATNNPQSRIMDIEETLSDDTVSQFQPLLIEIPDGASDQVINLNGIEPDKLLILSDKEISIKINGSSTAIAVKKLFLDETNITSLSVSNSSGETATVRLGLGK